VRDNTLDFGQWRSSFDASVKYSEFYIAEVCYFEHFKLSNTRSWPTIFGIYAYSCI